MAELVVTRRWVARCDKCGWRSDPSLQSDQACNQFSYHVYDECKPPENVWPTSVAGTITTEMAYILGAQHIETETFLNPFGPFEPTQNMAEIRPGDTIVLTINFQLT